MSGGKKEAVAEELRNMFPDSCAPTVARTTNKTNGGGFTVTLRFLTKDEVALLADKLKEVL